MEQTGNCKEQKVKKHLNVNMISLHLLPLSVFGRGSPSELYNMEITHKRRKT
jgi:hypothetical protein